MTGAQRWIVAGVVLMAFLFRVWALDLRPAHFDEGVNGVLIDEMREKGFYEYHPENYHGPLHFYVLFAGQQLFGRSLWVLRMPTVLVGTATVLLLFSFRRWLAFRICLVAALAAALSPAMIFYARDAIHEAWLPFFALLAVYGGFGCAQDRRRGDAWWVGLGLAGMVLTKETYLLHWIAAGIAIAWLMILKQAAARPWLDGRPDAMALFAPPEKAKRNEPVLSLLPRSQAFVVGLVSLGVVVAFYSGFGMSWKGVSGLWETWVPMFVKGYGEGDHSEEAHHKELFYYVKLLWFYEWPALLGLIAAPVVGLAPGRWLWGGGMIVRFMALFGCGSLAAYSLVAYKTPWCMLAALPPLFLVVGWLVDRLFALLGAGTLETRVGIFLLIMLLAQPALAAWRLNFRNYTDDGRRYVYVQTKTDINKLLRPVRELVERDPLNRYLRGQIFGEGHPLIWELGDLPYVSFFEEQQAREDYDGDFLLIPESRGWEIEARLRGVYFKERYLPRDYGTPCWLYLAADRFAPVLPGREPEFHPRIPQEVAP